MSCVPRIYALEIHITYRCNLRCSHCHNLVSQAPSREDMTLEHLSKLLDDSIKLKYPWEWLVLHGGEPCLHPQFQTVCSMLRDYKKDHNPTVNLKCTTNGYGPGNEESMKIVTEYGIEVCSSNKNGVTGDIVYHTPYCSSPTDTGEPFNLGCFQSSECGICYTMRGFYECSPAGAAWRVMGYPPLVIELKDLTAEKLAEGFNVHCKHCGYARCVDRNFIQNPTAPMSETWIKALAQYKSNAC